MRGQNGQYPREFLPLEKDLIAGVLPNDRDGYRRYVEDIAGMSVIAQGMRGNGHLILGRPGAVPDVDSPLSPVVAFGAYEFQGGEILIAVHGKAEEQIHIELMTSPGDTLPVLPVEVRRWTYSSWGPGKPSPCSGAAVREISVSPVNTLVVAETDKRFWLNDSISGMNQLIPITTFYGELMIVERIRDPEVVLKPARFFADLPRYSDISLKKAFLAYNEIHPKTEIRAEVVAFRKRRSSLLYRLLKLGLGQ